MKTSRAIKKLASVLKYLAVWAEPAPIHPPEQNLAESAIETDRDKRDKSRKDRRDKRDKERDLRRDKGCMGR